MDAAWWSSNSCEEVQVVLIVSIQKATRQVVLERWQLAPAGTLTPPSPDTVSNLQENALLPLEKQSSVSPDSAHCAQHIEISRTSNTVMGGPLYLPFKPVIGAMLREKATHHYFTLVMRSCFVALVISRGIILHLHSFCSYNISRFFDSFFRSTTTHSLLGLSPPSSTPASKSAAS